MPRAAILGPGGVGGFLAAALDRAGEEPVVVARAETAEHIDRDGLRVQSVRLGDFSARPRAVTTLEAPVDVLLVATKSLGLRAALVGCIEEAAVVANADGGRIDPAARLAELDEAHAGLGSSMQRDLAAGREPELDAIPGSVLRAGARHGIECPTIARLVLRIAERAGTDPPRY
jgi:ketopantoate reductase